MFTAHAQTIKSNKNQRDFVNDLKICRKVEQAALLLWVPGAASTCHWAVNIDNACKLTTGIVHLPQAEAL